MSTLYDQEQVEALVCAETARCVGIAEAEGAHWKKVAQGARRGADRQMFLQAGAAAEIVGDRIEAEHKNGREFLERLRALVAAAASVAGDAPCLCENGERCARHRLADALKPFGRSIE